MSLINQMLKDLEKRTTREVSPEISFSGLFSNEAIDSSESKTKFGMIIIIFIFFSILFAFFYHKHFFKISHVNHKTSSVIVPAIINEVTPTKPSVQDIVSIAHSPSTLTGMRLEMQDDVTQLHFKLDQNPFYSLETDNNQTKLLIELTNTHLMANLPAVDYLKSAIKGMEMSNDMSGNLIITLSLNESAELQRFEIVNVDNNTSELQIDILQKKMNESNAEKPIKKPIEMFNIEQQYKNALDAQAYGEEDKAIELLTDLNEKHPDYLPAKEALIAIMMENGNFFKAKRLLMMGLEQDPNYIPFIELKARILINENKINSALDLLQRVTPSMQKHAEYYAMMAALYQRQGQFNLAAQLYEKLLNYHPNQGMFWVGLAVALETQGKTQEAKAAYIKANASAGLNRDTAAFVQTRINGT